MAHRFEFGTHLVLCFGGAGFYGALDADVKLDMLVVVNVRIMSMNVCFFSFWLNNGRDTVHFFSSDCPVIGFSGENGIFES